MDNVTVTLHALAVEMAEKAGVDRADVDNFLRALTIAVTSALAESSAATIKGIGTFAATADGDVTFTPDNELAEEVNAPFAFFEPVDLDDDVTLDDISLDEEAGESNDTSHDEPAPEAPAEEPSTTDDETPEESAASEGPEAEGVPPVFVPVQSTPEEEPPTFTPEPAVIPTLAGEPENEEEPEHAEVPAQAEEPESPEVVVDASEHEEESRETESESESEPEPEPNHDSEHEPEYQTEPQSAFHWSWLITGLSIGLILGIAAGYFLQPRIDNWLGVPAATEESEAVAAADTIEATVEVSDSALSQSADTAVVDTPAVVVPAQKPSKEIKYDTIRRNRFLTTMAREHYGQMEYWVYIYLANSDKLGNPDGARPGTVVRIPDLSEYGVEGRSEAEIMQAKRKAVEIYAPYRK